jgi:hypothetical protein
MFIFRDRPAQIATMRRAQFHRDRIASSVRPSADDQAESHDGNCHAHGIFLRLRDYDGAFARVMYANCLRHGLVYRTQGQMEEPIGASIDWIDKTPPGS